MSNGMPPPSPSPSPMPGPGPGPAPGGGGAPPAANAIEGNRSPLDKQDMLTQAGRMMEDGVDIQTITLGDFLGRMGLDLNGPALEQLSRFTDGILAGSDPLTKAEAIGAGANATPMPPGGPSTMQPPAAGMPPIGGAPMPPPSAPPPAPGGGMPGPIAQVLGE